MDKVIIVGVFEFLGFHVCKKLLNEGVEVTGVHIESAEEHYVEFKQMEIGRNANFRINSHLNWWEGSKDQDVVLIVDYYDFFMTKRENQLLTMVKLDDGLLKTTSFKGKIIFLLPIPLLVDKSFERSAAFVHTVMEQLKNNNMSFQAFYLPTVYGEWQPKHFSFQHSFTNTKEVRKIDEREWTGDALDVEDVMNTLWQLMNEEGTEYLFKSADENSWERCAQFLNITDAKEIIEQEVTSFTGEVKLIRTSSPYQKRLEEQRLHYQKLKLLDG